MGVKTMLPDAYGRRERTDGTATFGIDIAQGEDGRGYSLKVFAISQYGILTLTCKLVTMNVVTLLAPPTDLSRASPRARASFVPHGTAPELDPIF